MGAQLFFQGLAGIACTLPHRKLKMAGGAPEKSASENRRAPERLPVEIEINKNVFVQFALSDLLEIIAQACWTKRTVKTKEKSLKKIDLLKLIDFLSFHTKEIEHLDHNIGLSIKNKSSKRKLSRGDG